MKYRLGVLVCVLIFVATFAVKSPSTSASAAPHATFLTQATDADLPLAAGTAQSNELLTANANSIQLVSQFGGVARMVGVQGNYAYVLGAGKFTVLDISNPLAPIEVAILRGIPPAVVNYNKVIVHGDLVLIVGRTGDTGYLQIINVASPTIPLLGGYLALDSVITGIAASGDYAFLLGAWVGMYVINIEDYSSPAQVSLELYDRAASLAIVGNYVYVHTVNFVHVEVFPGTWNILDVSDPTNPSPINWIRGWTLDPGIVIGDYLYTQNSIYDVSLPSFPRQLENVSSEIGSSITAQDGNYLYVITSPYWISELRILNVTNPELPTVVTRFSLEPRHAQGLSVAGNYVWIDDIAGRVRAIDVSNRSAPVETGVSYDMVTDSNGVAATGDYLYSVNGRELNTLDVSNPVHPQSIGTMNFVGSYWDITVRGDYAYVPAGGYGLRTISIQNPAAPSEVSYFDDNGDTVDIAIEGDILYTADGNRGMGIFSLGYENGANPNLIRWFYTSDYARSITIADHYAYLALNGSLVQILDLASPANPTLVSTYDAPGDVEDVVVRGNYAYLAAGDLGLIVLDIANPSTPTLAASYNLHGHASATEVMGHYLYVAGGNDGVYILDIANPTYPVLVGSYNTGGFAESLAINGDYVYVADSNGGLVILRFDNSGTEPTLPDYIVEHIEVTQAIQDLENSVPLIAGKTTYARVHVYNLGAPSDQLVGAKLCRTANDCITQASNPGGLITIKSNPDRGELNDSFFFLLPDSWAAVGNGLQLTATVNTTSQPESNTSNNTYSLGAHNQVPIIKPSYPLYVRLFNVNYSIGVFDLNHVYRIPETRKDLEMIKSWLLRAYPIAEADLHVYQDSIYLENTPLLHFTIGAMSIINSNKILDALSSNKGGEEIYYGAVIDGDYTNPPRGGAVVRGKADPNRTYAVEGSV